MKRNYPSLPCSVFCKGKKNGLNESMTIYSNSGCILYEKKKEEKKREEKLANNKQFVTRRARSRFLAGTNRDRSITVQRSGNKRQAN